MKLVNRSAPLAKVGLKNAKPYAIAGAGPVWLYGYMVIACWRAAKPPWQTTPLPRRTVAQFRKPHAITGVGFVWL